MDAIYFSGCAGWLHPPAAATPRRDLGVVLCSALGRDERCTHRPLRILANRLAADGFPVLRFDYPGQGDSCDVDGQADAVPLWLDAIRDGRARLTSAFGLSGAVLGGVRLGASLALAAADPGDALLLLAPVASGRSWLAKLRFSAAQGRRDREAVAHDRGLDADGLFLSPSTCTGLAGIDLMAPGPRRGPTFLALANRASKGLSSVLEGRVGSLEIVDFPGYERLFADPNDNEAPDALFETASAWVSARSAQTALTGGEAIGALSTDEGLVGPGWRERAVTFGDHLCGVLALPEAHKKGGDAVLILNTGGDPKAGIGRFAVRAARRFAAGGRTVLRFDFAGVGDSQEPKGVERIHVYETPRGAELDAALDLVRAEGCDRVFLVGVSAGGFHALWSVLHGGKFFGAYCISTIKLVWRTGDAITIGTRRWGRATGAYLADAVNPAAWARLMRGKVAVGPIASSIAARILALLKPEHLTTESRSFQRQVKAASDRGDRVGLLMGVADAALDEVEAHFGRGGRRFVRLPGMTLTVVEGIDHGLVYERSRLEALMALEHWLDEASAR